MTVHPNSTASNTAAQRRTKSPRMASSSTSSGVSSNSSGRSSDALVADDAGPGAVYWDPGEGGMLPEEQAANSRYFYALSSAKFGWNIENRSISESPC